jgi:outer membrane protein assembly factor BamE (lipoprotein component of BamABCDE complex)
MRWMKKYLPLMLLAIAAIFAIELWRERVVYRRASNALERGSRQLRQGMAKEEVKKILGEPQGAGSNEPEEVWYWEARNYQGALWGLLGLNTTKGHFEVVVSFDGQGKVTKIFGGVN